VTASVPVEIHVEMWGWGLVKELIPGLSVILVGII